MNTAELHHTLNQIEELAASVRNGTLMTPAEDALSDAVCGLCQIIRELHPN